MIKNSFQPIIKAQRLISMFDDQLYGSIWLDQEVKHLVDIWSNIILGLFLMVILDEIPIWIGRLNKTDCGWVWSNQLKVWIEQKGWPSPKYKRIPPAWLLLIWDIRSSSLHTWTETLAFLYLQPAGLEAVLLRRLQLQLADCVS